MELFSIFDTSLQKPIATMANMFMCVHVFFSNTIWFQNMWVSKEGVCMARIMDSIGCGWLKQMGMGYGLESKKKAYATPYEALERGVVQDAFVDFTRGAREDIYMFNESS